MTKKQSPKSSRILQVCHERDYDYVNVNGKKIYLGRSGTPEAQAKFLELQRQLFIDPTLSSLKLQPAQVTPAGVTPAGVYGDYGDHRSHW